MDPRLAWLIPAFSLFGVAGLFIWRWMVGRREPNYLAAAEYWVYGQSHHLPAQDALMTRMISENPHARPGFAPIGAREGMLFTDIRLHLAAATKHKNPFAFRPDLFSDALLPDAEILGRLAGSTSFFRVKYQSESVLPDRRHLQFLPHMADAVSALTSGRLVYDRVTEEIWTAEDFSARLAQWPMCDRPDFHLRVLWRMDSGAAEISTRGLRKVGRPELFAGPFEPDEEVLITGLMMRAAFQLYREPDTFLPLEFEEYGDVFVIAPLSEIVDGRQPVDIRRRRAA